MTSDSYFYVVNLPHRSDRRSEFARTASVAGFSSCDYEFFEAFYVPEFGGLGCARSHCAVLAHCLLKTSADYCIVLEDDFDFRGSREELNSSLESISAYDVNWEVILLAGTNTLASPTGFRNVRKVFESSSTAGYIVRRAYLVKLLTNFLEATLLMERYSAVSPREVIYNRFAIDQYWKSLQRSGRWYSVAPMLGYQRTSFSDIEGGIKDYVSISA
jgi:glycosyl transferase family 25